MWAPGQPAPPFAQPPLDEGLKQRIDTLCSYAAKNGHSFVQMMGERQGANPEFAFLRGGDGAPYFAWALCCALTGLNPAAPPAAAPRQPPLPQQPQDTSGALGALPPEVASGWQQVLGLLNGSRDSIRNSQQWFMACAPHAAGMAEMMLQQVLALGEHERQLHVIYLANDVLFKALAMRPPSAGHESDGVAQVLRPRLGRMLRRAYESGGLAPEALQNLQRMVGFWAEKGVYSRAEVDGLATELLGVAAQPAAAAAPQQFAPQQQQQQQQFQPHAGMPAAGQPPLPQQAAQAQYAGQQQAYPGPPPPSAYYPEGYDPQQQQQHYQQQQQQQQQGYGAPPAFPGEGLPQAYGQQPQYPGAPGQFQPLTCTAPPQYPGSQPPYPGAPQQQYPGQPPVGYFPPQGAYQAAAPEPEPEPFDPMCFPPGLIPKLVEEKLKTDPPYSPLSILDIERSGVPPPPAMDDYLKSRVDKFYAQLSGYRAGMLYSDIEVDAPRAMHFSDRGAPARGPPMPDLPHAGLGLGAAPGLGLGAQPVNDGSFTGKSFGRGITGLGFAAARQREAAAPGAEATGLGLGVENAEAGPSGDVFSSYRHMRSKGYHTMIVSNAAKKFGR